jgi:hypothetical protein
MIATRAARCELRPLLQWRGALALRRAIRRPYCGVGVPVVEFRWCHGVLLYKVLKSVGLAVIGINPDG